jgi:hypothetical protein
MRNTLGRGKGARSVFEEPRPTVVSVLGWVWLILGALLVAGGIAAIAILVAAPEARSVRGILRIGSATVELPMGVLGFIAARAFLRLAPWSRSALEVLSWLLLVGTLTSVVGILLQTGPMGESGSWMMAGVGLVSAVVYGAPVALMIRSLRSHKVRSAMGQPLPNNGINSTPVS